MDKQLALQNNRDEIIPLLSNNIPTKLIPMNQEKPVTVQSNKRVINREECGVKELGLCCCPVLGGSTTWLTGKFICNSCGSSQALWGFVLGTSALCCCYFLFSDDDC